MAKLIYAAIASLDGYVEDEKGRFDWAAPDEEVHAFVNDLERPIGTYLYGRRMYETMVFWETASTETDEPERRASGCSFSSSFTRANSASVGSFRPIQMKPSSSLRRAARWPWDSGCDRLSPRSPPARRPA